MQRNLRLSRWQQIGLGVTGALMIMTWAFGGESGHKTALGATLPWVIATNGVLAGLFMLLLRNDQKKLDLAILCAMASLFDFGVLPLSWLSVPIFNTSISVSGMLVAVSLFIYVLYFARMFSGPSKSSAQSRDGGKSVSIFSDVVYPWFLSST